MADDKPVYLDETHQRIAEFVNDFYDETEREDALNVFMEKAGYERISGWGPPAQPPRGGGRTPVPKGSQGGGRGHPGFRRPGS